VRYVWLDGMNCPRCQGGRMFLEADGDATCISCGFASYALAPLPRVNGHGQLAIEDHAGGKPKWAKPVLSPLDHGWSVKV
jgi:hypothetical protein